MDKNVQDFPYNLYSLVGRANLLKLLGFQKDALEAYQTIIERRPDYAPAKYGKAAIHISLGQFAEAQKLLPHGFPGTLTEWVGFHIRGMMHLRRGEVGEAIKILKLASRGHHFIGSELSLRRLSQQRGYERGNFPKRPIW